jgi:hypothetical protein
VVIPQVGHGWPKAAAHAHGGRPSWVWVPWPATSGRSQAAIPKTSALPVLTARAARRRPMLTFQAAGAGRGVGETIAGVGSMPELYEPWKGQGSGGHAQFVDFLG